MLEPRDTVDDYDDLDPQVESLADEPKDVRGVRFDLRGQSLTYTAQAQVRTTRELLILDIRYHARRGSRVQASLRRRDGTIIRLWHYHPSHRNPNGESVEFAHKHFSTTDRPIIGLNHRGEPTWAYSTYDINPESMTEVVEGFCRECNIFGVQLPVDEVRDA